MCILLYNLSTQETGKEMPCMFNALGRLTRIEVCKEASNNKFIE